MRRSSLYRAAIGLLVCVVAILVSIAFVDRPVARFMHANTQDKLVFIAMAALANLPRPFASAYLCWSALFAWSGRILPPLMRLLVLVSVTTLVALMIKNELKFAFGRPWPESHPLPWIDNHPSFIRDRTFGFFPFHGGSSYDAFPSGHTTAISAPMAVLWAKIPQYRLLWGAIILAVVTGLIGADFHFVSDTIAGFFLGIGVAAGMVSLLG